MVLTNYHVVGENTHATVFFPEFDGGEVIPKPLHYIGGIDKFGIKGKVVARSSGKDLALLELDRVPKEIGEIPLSTQYARSGNKLYSIGAAGIELNDFSGSLWRLSAGEARGRNEAKLPFPDGQVIDAMFLENQKPINSGDSGGPTVNDRAALVGLVSNSRKTQALVNRDIDLIEIRAFLEAHAKAGGWKWDGPTKKPAHIGDKPAPNDPDSLANLAKRLADPLPNGRLEAVQRIAVYGNEALRLLPVLVTKLDDSDLRVQRAVEEALDKIGPPGKAELVGYEAVLQSGGPNSRRVLLKFYSDAASTPVSTARVPALVRHLGDESAINRQNALRALGHVGPECKPLALGRMVELGADAEEATADRAFATLAAWSPYAAADVAVLAPFLEHENGRIRAFAARQLGDLAPDAATSMKWFRTLLRDENPDVLAAAAKSLGRWGAAVRECAGALETCCLHENLGVATAALGAYAKVATPADAWALLRSVADSKTASAPVKAAADEAALELDWTDPNAILPAIGRLLKAEKDAVRISTLKKLLALGKAAKPATALVVACLPESSEAIKLAALAVLAGLGADAGGHSAAIAKLLAEGETDVALDAAIDTLVKLGPQSAESLGKALQGKLKMQAQLKILAAIRDFGVKGQAAHRELIGALSQPSHSLAALRQAKLDAVDQGKEWEPDPASEILVKFGGDGLVAVLVKMSEFEAKTVGKVRVKRALNAPDVMVQFWAVAMLAGLDPQNLGDEKKLVVSERLKYISGNDPVKTCVRIAKGGLTKYEEKK